MPTWSVFQAQSYNLIKSFMQLFTCTLLILAFSQKVTAPSSVCEGSDVILQCVIAFTRDDNTTFVQPAVWSRNGVPVQMTNVSGTSYLLNHNQPFNATTGGFTDLVITNVTLEDDNTMYTCTATGASISKSVVLNVTSKLYKYVCI